MAICPHCNKEMLAADGCDDFPVTYSDNVTLDRVPYGQETRADWGICGEHCPDCNAKLGHPHHWGCDVEECPRCHNQMITCSCTLYGEDDD